MPKPTMSKAADRSGYSGTPLAKKLGIGEGAVVAVLHAPDDYETLLRPVPSGVSFASRATAKSDLVHLFAVERAELQKELAVLRRKIDPATPVWVSWPKKASKVPTSITEDVIREVALPLGFVDVKVCAVNSVWSGLKLVVRKELR
jgi:hypothetical protein